MTDRIISEAVFRQKYLGNKYVIADNESINLAKQKKFKYLCEECPLTYTNDTKTIQKKMSNESKANKK